MGLEARRGQYPIQKAVSIYATEIQEIFLTFHCRYAILTEIEMLYCKSETSLDPQGTIPLDVRDYCCQWPLAATYPDCGTEASYSVN